MGGRTLSLAPLAPRAGLATLTLAISAIVAFCSFGLTTGLALLIPEQCVAGKAMKQISVKRFGAQGNGSHNDTAAFAKAMSAAVRRNLTLYIPKGTYKVSGLTLPDGLSIRGAGRNSSWIKGEVVFGSNQRVSHLKLGRAGYSTRNGPDAHNTTFTACRFRGGGGSLHGVNSSVVQLGNAFSCNHIAFRNCLIERNLGTEDPSYSRGFNNVDLIENGASEDGAHVDSITFDRCHIGVSNRCANRRRSIGSPRMGLECFTWDGGDGIAAHGWSNVRVIGCILEGADMCTLDLADSVDSSGQHVSGPAVIRGCVLKGGGYDGRYWGYAVCCEAPRGVLIENNTFYRAHDTTLAVSWSRGINASGYRISGNRFILNVNNGITPGSHSMIQLRGDRHLFSNNIIRTSKGSTVLELQEFSNGRVVGNKLLELRRRHTPTALQLFNVTGTAVTRNTLRTAASSKPVIYYAGTNWNNTITGNAFIHN